MLSATTATTKPRTPLITMAKKKIAKSKQPTFEQSLDELETIVARLEGGQLGLAESLREYEHGVKHLKSCYDQLSTAERRIELVSRVDAAGNPKIDAFDDEDSASLDEKGATRSRRRNAKAGAPTAKRRSNSEVDDDSSLF